MRSRKSLGYTLVEVLAAVIVSSVGLAGVFTLQLRNLQGGEQAHALATASNLADRYATALRLEAFAWTGETMPTSLASSENVWQTLTPYPVDENGRESSAHSVTGSPFKRQRFCAHYRMVSTGYGLAQAEVRVVWPRDLQDVESLTSTSNGDPCNSGVATYNFQPSEWYSVTMPVTLRRHPE